VVSEEDFRAYFSDNFGVIFKEAFMNIFQGVKMHTMGSPLEGAAHFKTGVRALLRIQTNLEAVFGSRGVWNLYELPTELLRGKVEEANLRTIWDIVYSQIGKIPLY
jgi:hypothetical protein